mmetsp:Transcript_40046/g.127432  ORF Transcript_40046/g.127432 Transcript_40046/m.127432 type:complete len:269 (+) Transcript_40046:383-1189(+)
MQVPDADLLVHDLRRHLLQLLHERCHAGAKFQVRLGGLHVRAHRVQPCLRLAEPPQALLDVHGQLRACWVRVGVRAGCQLSRPCLGRLACVGDLEAPQLLACLIVQLLVALQPLANELELLDVLYPTLVELVQLVLHLLEPALSVHALDAVTEGPVLLLLCLDERAQRLQAFLLRLHADMQVMALLLKHVKLLGGVGETRLKGHQGGAIACCFDCLQSLRRLRRLQRADGEVLSPEALNLREPLVQVHEALAGILGIDKLLLDQALQA